MLNFEQRIGPSFQPAVQYPPMKVPAWWQDAKFGIFIHWGLYSIPAWAEIPDPETYIGAEDAYARHSYAEWFGNTCRIPNSPAQAFLAREYGLGTAYEDFADLFTAENFDADDVVKLCVDAGARYVIPTTKHHDGFCLWNTCTTPFNAQSRGAHRDLIGEFAQACRTHGLKFGTYYSGALDWHVSDFAPIQSNRDLFALRRNDAVFAQYCASQFLELVDTYQPDIFWNDIEWPNAGKGHEPYGVAALWEHYLKVVPHGVVNDRFGVPAHGHLTREYSVMGNYEPRPWEATRGLGHSFGVNQNETAANTLQAADVIQLLCQTVAHGGNLLLNIGLDATGKVPLLYRDVLIEVGQWLQRYGKAIYGSRPDLEIKDLTAEQAILRVGDSQYLLLYKPQQECRLPIGFNAAEFNVRSIDGMQIPCDKHTGAIMLPDEERQQPVTVVEIVKGS